MKVLYYNWCPIPENEGGGIAVYQRNLLNYMQHNSVDIDAYFLCSGFFYDNTGHTYVREEKGEYNARVFSLVNSPVFAPMRAPHDNFEVMINDTTTLNEMHRFIEKYGPFDAIHFQTLEGLSLKVLSLKETFPDTKFLYSVHNYTSICPNVMLWTEDDENCQALHVNCQNNCSNCMNRYEKPSTTFLKRSRHLLNQNHNKLYYYTRGVKYVSRKYLPVKRLNNNDIYQNYLEESISGINRYVDNVLAVSEKVKEIVIKRGIKENIVDVCYIGTKFAEKSLGYSIVDANNNPFGIVYMGYMRKEKGFYFFLSSLEKMKDEMAKNMSVTFASKITDKSAAKRIEKLKKKFSDIRIFDGYTHDDIPNILGNAHIGVVPVLWEDNLPQVTIEMISCGVPVLASSYGGASELCSSDYFCFEGNNTDDFLNKVETIYNDRSLLQTYWNSVQKLTTMNDHVHKLMRFYER